VRLESKWQYCLVLTVSLLFVREILELQRYSVKMEG